MGKQSPERRQLRRMQGNDEGIATFGHASRFTPNNPLKSALSTVHRYGLPSQPEACVLYVSNRSSLGYSQTQNRLLHPSMLDGHNFVKEGYHPLL